MAFLICIASGSFRPILYQLSGLILCRSMIEKKLCVCFGGEGDEFLTALRVSAEVFSALLVLPLCKFLLMLSYSMSVHVSKFRFCFQLSGFLDLYRKWCEAQLRLCVNT